MSSSEIYRITSINVLNNLNSIRRLPLINRFTKFKIVKKLYDYFIFSLKDPNKILEIDGNKMYLDPKDSLNLSIFGTFEPFETRLFKKLVKTNDIIIDIGANIGYYTLIAAKLVGERGIVYAFEPSPENFEILVKNIKLNCYNNIIPIKKAIADRTGILKLYLSESNYGDHRIYNSSDSYNRASINIESISLDDFFISNESNINIIKMDIQGAEGLAFYGMRDLLIKSNNLMIFMEYWPSAIDKTGIQSQVLLDNYASLGFNIYYIDEEKSKLYPISIDECFSKCSYNFGHINLLLSRREINCNLF